MLKYFFLILSIFIICQNLKAQKIDTTFIYKTNAGKVVPVKDSADYLMMVIKPVDTIADPFYAITEYYLDGTRKLVGKALKDSHNNTLVMQGTCVEYFPNGHMKSVATYKYGFFIGDLFLYYPNGKVYAYEKFQYSNVLFLISCRDSTGKILSENGKGDWIEYNEKFDKIIAEGPIEDNFKNGEWHGSAGDTVRYVINYKKGKAGSGIGYDVSNKAYPFNDPDVMAAFAGPGTYLNFLTNHLRYPPIDRESKIEGRVIVQFIIQTDGTATNFKLLRTPDLSMGNEAIRAISLMHWHPAAKYGIPTRSYFTLPIRFGK